MAKQNTRQTYPRMPTKSWWELRRKFIQSPPRQVTPDLLQSVLGINEGAAKNLIPPLRAIGLIDDEGRSADRANDWRSDEHYEKVCQEICAEVYPEGLLDAHPGPKPVRADVTQWFMRNTGTGEGAAKQMAAFYVLLCEADPSAGDQTRESRKKSNGKPKHAQPTAAKRAPKKDVPETTPTPTPTHVPQLSRPSSGLPDVHIDIQVHIAADASPEQIDQVFASMAKHLYGKL